MADDSEVLSPAQQASVANYERKAGIGQPDGQAPAPEPTNQPSWDAIQATDEYKNARADQKNYLLQKYTETARQNAAINSKTPEELNDKQSTIDQFEKSQTQESKPPVEGYNILEEGTKSLLHSAGTTLAAMPASLAQLAGGILSFPESKPAPTVQDIGKLSVDDAKKELEGLQKQEEALAPKFQRIQEWEAAKKARPNDQGLIQEFKDLGSVTDVANTLRNQKNLNTRIDALQKYIGAGGDKMAIPSDVQPSKFMQQTMRYPLKLEKWGQKNIPDADQRYYDEHPLISGITNGLGTFAAYGLEAIATEGLGASAGVVHAVQDIQWFADTYRNSYQEALAKIDNRIKNGEQITPGQRDQMATNYAWTSLVGVPLQIGAGMMAGRLMKNFGMSMEKANGLVDNLVKNVLTPAAKETATQSALGLGYSNYEALAQQLTGVDKTGPTWATQWAGLGQGVGMGGFAGMVHGAGLIKEHASRINQLPEAAKEPAIKNLPENIQNPVRAQTAVNDAAKAENEAAVQAQETSPQVS